MDPSNATSGRRNKRRGGRSNNSGQGAERGQGGNQNRRRKRKRPMGGRGRGGQPLDKLPPTHKDDSSVLGGRMLNKTDAPKESPLAGPPDGFGLFSAYYLGVTAEDRYQKPSLEETARRYGVAPAEVRDLLTEHRLDGETLKKCRFDLEGAKLDIRLAPEGISRIEIAREHYGYYLEALETL